MADVLGALLLETSDSKFLFKSVIFLFIRNIQDLTTQA